MQLTHTSLKNTYSFVGCSPVVIASDWEKIVNTALLVLFDVEFYALQHIQNPPKSALGKNNYEQKTIFVEKINKVLTESEKLLKIKFVKLLKVMIY